MSLDYGALFAADIRRYRDAEVKFAARAVADAGRPVDVVRNAAFLAGLEWDSRHQQYARSAQAVTS